MKTFVDQELEKMAQKFKFKEIEETKQQKQYETEVQPNSEDCVVKHQTEICCEGIVVVVTVQNMLDIAYNISKFQKKKLFFRIFFLFNDMKYCPKWWQTKFIEWR